VDIAATKDDPIVFSTGGDPVKLGFVASMNRPGGECHWHQCLDNDMEPSDWSFCAEIAPRASVIGFL